MASRKLLYASRQTMFSTLHITARSAPKLLTSLADPHCTIPYNTPKALTINGDIPLPSSISPFITSPSPFREHLSLQRVDISNVHWDGVVRSLCIAMMGLSNVRDVNLTSVVVDDSEEARIGFLKFLQGFPQLQKLDLQNVQLKKVARNAPPSIPIRTCMTHWRDPLSRIRKKTLIALSLDSSDGLKIVQDLIPSHTSDEQSNIPSMTPLLVSSVTFHRPMQEERSTPLAQGNTVVGLQNDALRRFGAHLSSLKLVTSAHELLEKGQASDLSHGLHLRHVRVEFSDIWIRRVGGKPFDYLLRTLRSAPAGDSELPGSSLTPLRTIVVSLHFTKWLGTADVDLLSQLFPWEEMDETIRDHLGWCSDARDSDIDSSSEDSESRRVKFILKFDIWKEFGAKGAVNELEEESKKKAAMTAVKTQIRTAMEYCESAGLLEVCTAT